MRQRVTYLLSGRESFDLNPAALEISPTSLAHPHGQAVEERRITLGLSELPQELRLFLEDFHEIHFRLVSNKNYAALSPNVSRLPAGLHIFFTPKPSSSASTRLCSKLASLLGEDPQCNFSKPPILSKRSARAATYQYYHDLGSLETSDILRLCSDRSTNPSALCKILSASKSAAYVDYDYDAISHTLDITILSDSPRPISAEKSEPADRLEIGILNTEKATEPEEISLGGFLTVVGEDDQPSATLFSFPARHHRLPAGDETTFHASFQLPTGLHPKMDITFPRRYLSPPKEGCALHAYYTLPSFVFIDRYQFSDPLFLESQNLVALQSLSGEEDLEAPDWAVKQWGSAALFELAHPKAGPSDASNWTVTIPMHLRYVDNAGSGSHDVPVPVVFWACQTEESSKMATNPFDRTNLGYDDLIGKAMFYHVPSQTEVLAKLNMPVMMEASWAPAGTAIVVMLAFSVLWYLLGQTKSSPPPAKPKAK